MVLEALLVAHRLSWSYTGGLDCSLMAFLCLPLSSCLQLSPLTCSMVAASVGSLVLRWNGGIASSLSWSTGLKGVFYPGLRLAPSLSFPYSLPKLPLPYPFGSQRGLFGWAKVMD